jgi:hypothetical protein
VYYNRTGISGKEWSVDTGPGTPEIVVGAVRWEHIKLMDTGLLDGPPATPEDPKAWVVLEDVTITLDMQANRVTLSRGQF